MKIASSLSPSRLSRFAAQFWFPALVSSSGGLVLGCSTEPVESGETQFAQCPGETPWSCGTYCADLNTNNVNCGSCGTVCSTGTQCNAGACECQPGLTPCAAGCTETMADGLNCGGCGIVCDAGTVCSLGACSASCAPGLTQCGSSCVDATTNVANCGACGNACGDGKACVAGTCQCPAGQTCEDGPPISGTGGGTGVPGTGGAGTGGAATGGTGSGGTGSGGTGSGGGSGIHGGYFSNATWKGYLWTGKFGVATISPDDFGDIAEFPACAKGNVTKGDDNGAMVGWNLNQMIEDDPTGTTVTPTADGITVSIDSKTNSQLRLQIQTPDGETDPTARWCADIGTGGTDIFVPYSSFNTHCWEPAKGTYYNGEAISQMLVQVPGTQTGDFDFCIQKVEETAGGVVGNPGCDLASAPDGSLLSATLDMNNATERRNVNTGAKQYFVQNNVFNPASGDFKVFYNGADFTVTTQTMSQSTSGAPAGYPSLFIGSNAGGHGLDTPGSNLPRQIGSLTSVKTAWRWTPPSSGQYNAAYDVWLSEGSGENGVHNRTFLMVWFDRTGGINAEGEGIGHGAGVFNVDGKSFHVYVSTQFEGRPIISYVAQSQIREWSFDLKDFIDDAKGRNSPGGNGSSVVKDSYTLTNIFAGFEVWSGSVGIQTNAFCADVQ